MCLITEDKKIKTATEDMVVWKEVIIDDEGIRSSFQRFPYQRGKTYKAKITEISKQWASNIPCYDEVDAAYLNEKFPTWYDERNENLMYIERGFHSALNQDRLNEPSWDDHEIMKFIVPEGSEYYQDATGCIVSNQIRLA